MSKLPEATVHDYHDKIMEKGWDESEAYVNRNLIDYIQQYLLRRLDREANMPTVKSDRMEKKDKRKTFVSAQTVTGQVKNAAPVGGQIPVASAVGVPSPLTDKGNVKACAYCRASEHTLEGCKIFKTLPMTEAKK
jgi:hypothetical protein